MTGDWLTPLFEEGCPIGVEKQNLLSVMGYREMVLKLSFLLNAGQFFLQRPDFLQYLHSETKREGSEWASSYSQSHAFAFLKI